jgi:nicotinate dehydrogenase subunit B
MGDRTAIPPYQFDHMRVVVNDMAPLVRASWLRGVSAMPNTFAHECYIDELAAAAAVDPVEFRLRHLRDERALDLIKEVVQRAGWQVRTGPRLEQIAAGRRRGQGVAYAQYLHGKFPGTAAAWSAWVAEVEVDLDSGEVQVSRVVVGQDTGLAINPAGIQHQIHGNVIQSISRTLKEEVSFDGPLTTNREWGTYPVLRFPDLPVIQVVMMPRPHDPPLGAGESASVPSAAAIANAIFDATGVRMREPPFTPERVRAALHAAQVPALRLRTDHADDVLLVGTRSCERGSTICAGSRHPRNRRRDLGPGCNVSLRGSRAPSVWRRHSGCGAPRSRPPPAPIRSCIQPGRSPAAENSRRSAIARCATRQRTARKMREADRSIRLLAWSIRPTSRPTSIPGLVSGPTRHSSGRCAREFIAMAAISIRPFPIRRSQRPRTGIWRTCMPTSCPSRQYGRRFLRPACHFRSAGARLLAFWNALFLRERQFVPDACAIRRMESGGVSSGRARSLRCLPFASQPSLGAEKSGSRQFAGGFADGWEVPPLTALSHSPIPWSEADLFEYLRTGASRFHGAAAGPMQPVVASLAQLPDTDLRAMAHYLASFNPQLAEAAQLENGRHS